MPRDPNDQAGAREPVGEESLIAEFWAPLAAGSSGAFGLKDDCAIISPSAGEELVVTTDALIAGVHFLADENPGAVAWKALAVNVSDLTAKGARPVAYVMNVALPAYDRRWLEAFADGLRRAQETFGCRLIGGDTDRTPGPLSIAITAFGTIPAGGMVQRSTARPGDQVFVTGTIGDATLGLGLSLDPQRQRRWGLDEDAARYLKGRFSRPQPPFAIAPTLRSAATAAMDISDGLVKDFDRLCRASAVAGKIEALKVPLSAAAEGVIRTGEVPLEQLLSGGEDYEVLATVPPSAAAEFVRSAADAGVSVTCIGIVTSGVPGATVVDGTGAPIRLAVTGWDHFMQP